MLLSQAISPAGQMFDPDVGTPQVGNLVRRLCLSVIRSDMVGSGRRLAAFNSGRGRVHAPQERWSRGCRRADVSFWFSQWLLPLPLAPKKKKSWLSRSRLSRPTPANTSNLPARARQPRHSGPAPHFSDKRPSCAAWLTQFHNLRDYFGAALWATASLWPIRPACCQDRGQDKC
jgi:hypothetical protein